jgi:hypothetical protein
MTVVRAAPAELSRREPAGSKDGQLFWRSARDELVLLPTARLEVDALSVMAPDRNASATTLSLGRARLDVAGWIFSKVYFDLAADFAAGFSVRRVDEIVAVAPWGDRAIFQFGQFDAPFTLENRTPDRYLDFLERGAAVRAFAIPQNKDRGLMVHGTNSGRNYYYAAGIFNREGPAATGVDGRFDLMARAWVAPFSFNDPDGLRAVTIGGSVWTGDRSTGPVFASQTTDGGYAFVDATVWRMSGATTPLALREQGRLAAVALELNAPFAHRFGLRFEWIAKRQPLAAFDATDAAHPRVVAGLRLSGFGAYGEIWAWVLGDDRIVGAPGAPGLGLPVRLRDFLTAPTRHGLMLSARVDYVDERLTEPADAVASGLDIASVGTTRLTAVTAGATYWGTRRARLSANYIFNHLEGVTPYLNGLPGKTEHELLVRMALAL